MRTTELGVYILGAVALVLLAAAGIAVPGAERALLAAVLSAGFAYASQLMAAIVQAHAEAGIEGPAMNRFANLALMVIALLFWLYGAVDLMRAI